MKCSWFRTHSGDCGEPGSPFLWTVDVRRFVRRLCPVHARIVAGNAEGALVELSEDEAVVASVLVA